MARQPLQNRVLPDGEIVAADARGTLTGNRGCLHDDDRRLVRRWQSKAWITCRLEWRGVRRVVMTPNRWTELFFLDEAVALAAGHRPCAFCRRADFNRFRDIFGADNGTPARAPQIDANLHRARMARREVVDPATLPDGSFIGDDRGMALIWRGKAWEYSPRGYGRPRQLPDRARALTPAPTRTVLAAGYVPMLHPSLGAGR